MKEPGHSPRTLWTQVIEVIQNNTGAEAGRALSDFCEQYRPVIVTFFWQRGWKPELAEDLAHDFFDNRILSRLESQNGFLYRARRGAEGGFRRFLASVLWDFHKDALKRMLAQKVGGGAVHVPIGEVEYSQLPQGPPPDVLHEMDAVLARKILDDAVGESSRSEVLLAYLKDGEMTVSQGAAALDISEGAFKVAVHRLLDRLRTRLRAEVSKLVGPDEKEISGELDYLLKILGKEKL
jgi:DNA-directed RNA polymerase specialized sigma24 family protein